MKNIFDWILKSSVDPSKLALTVKGLLVGAIPTIIFLSGVSNIQLSSEELTIAFDAVAQLIQASLTAISAVMIVWGFVRKLWVTLTK